MGESAFLAAHREEQLQAEKIVGDKMPERSAFERPGTDLLVGFIGADCWPVHRVKQDVRNLQLVLYGSTRRRQINNFRLFVFHLRSPPFSGSGIAGLDRRTRNVYKEPAVAPKWRRPRGSLFRSV